MQNKSKEIAKYKDKVIEAAKKYSEREASEITIAKAYNGLYLVIVLLIFLWIFLNAFLTRPQFTRH